MQASHGCLSYIDNAQVCLDVHSSRHTCVDSKCAQLTDAANCALCQQTHVCRLPTRTMMAALTMTSSCTSCEKETCKALAMQPLCRSACAMVRKALRACSVLSLACQGDCAQGADDAVVHRPILHHQHKRLQACVTLERGNACDNVTLEEPCTIT